MRWLFTLQLRTPGATVLLVTNKMDMTVGSRNVWKERRGLGYNVEYRCERNSTQVVLLEESCLIRCDNYNGIPSLIKRVLDQCVSSIEIPLAWELVFEFINALRCKHPPERACLEHLQIPVIGENAGTEWSDSFIAKEELSKIGRSVAERAKELWRSQNSKILESYEERYKRNKRDRQ